RGADAGARAAMDARVEGRPEAGVHPHHPRVDARVPPSPPPDAGPRRDGGAPAHEGGEPSPADAGRACTEPVELVLAPDASDVAIVILLDRSLSMNEPFGTATRWEAFREALVGDHGIVRALEDHRRMGLVAYMGLDACPDVLHVRADLGTGDAIAALMEQGPAG